MKPITTAAIIAILASQAHAFNHVWYWCGKSTTTCENEGKPWNGVYPTYDCGHKLKWDNYRQAYGKWYQSTDEWDDWEKKGGFKDCCHAAGKGACYSYQDDEYASLVAPNVHDFFPVLRYVREVFGMAQWNERAPAVREAVLETGAQFLSTAKEQRAALDTGKWIAWESVSARMLRQKREKNDTTFTVADMGNTAFRIVLIPGDLSPRKEVAHAPAQDDVYNGHRIPRGIAVVTNVWHIHHSEDDYKEPNQSVPDRFL
ncbi:related to O-methylsterigmatocystin oxidoreductase [Aspergillus terreus]|uniref:Related to O-methylsterigmatocystin oxidoreductase n=1 Tax=Aspergillus terreus TaxID=33178 RepID=A0A5M3Z9I5_ASPTE|nr:hypothetical protein ATETN484_0012010000 [Aspergillus terreus]GFF19348.1 related to O-methylsterigmatocystin oxidoreductase [Aspergillus terreus]